MARYFSKQSWVQMERKSELNVHWSQSQEDNPLLNVHSFRAGEFDFMVNYLHS